MKAKTYNFVLGVGSVMDLAPVRHLRSLGLRRTAADRMASHFFNVGVSLSAACQAYQVDAEATPPKTEIA